jgi:hypothetical protein
MSSGVRGLFPKASGAASYIGGMLGLGVRRLGRSMGGTRDGTNLASSVVRAGRMIRRNRTTVGAGVMGMGAGGALMKRRNRGSQNYPIY